MIQYRLKNGFNYLNMEFGVNEGAFHKRIRQEQHDYCSTNPMTYLQCKI